MILIKLGGSVITDKRAYRKFNRDVVSRLCSEIKRSGKDTVVVHGAGSFGHVLAKEHALSSGYKDESQIPAVAKVCYDVRELNSMVVNELNECGIPAISIPPGSCFMMDDGRLSIDNFEVIESMISKGIMPVLFGDVVQDRKMGFSICSGDQIMERLADALDPELTVFVSDIDGLFDSDPKVNADARMYRHVTPDILETVRTGSSVADVTGGVFEKMMAMLRISTPTRRCMLINGTVPDNLESALSGKEVLCTTAGGDAR